MKPNGSVGVATQTRRGALPVHGASVQCVTWDTQHNANQPNTI